MVCIVWLALFALVTFCRAADPVLAKPSAEQLAWQDLEIGLMISFGPSTYENTQQDENRFPLKDINPTQLDTDQWVRAAELIGAKYIVFTAKHSGGFCCWQTDTTDYSIKNTPWRGGKGDIVADLVKSCRKKGIKLGIYLSPADRKHGAPLTWGTDWKGPQGHAKNPADQPAYDKLFRAQLEELLNRYSDAIELWLDGDVQTEIGDVLKRYPKMLVVGGKYATVRTIGENGFAPSSVWSSIAPGGKQWLPAECPVPSRDTWYWFWNEETDHMLKSLDHMVEMYYHTVGHNAVLCLNANPDRSGLIPELDMRRYAEFGAEIKRRFDRSLAETKGKGSTIELAIKGAPMNVDLAIAREDSTDGSDRLRRVWPGAQVIDHAIIMEDISLGERVTEYVIEGFADGQWKELSRGTSIGHKKIDRFPPALCSKLRLRCTQSLAEPVIRKFAAYNTCWDWWMQKAER
jgi:alpha-L-fucosidase